MKKIIYIVSLFLANVSLAQVFNAEIIIENHRFIPETMELPSDQKIKLKVTNKDATPEEFESAELKREKIVPANSSIIVSFGPLKPGEYKFFGEFHEETAKGKFIVKE